jgi:hypothetical protein
MKKKPPVFSATAIVTILLSSLVFVSVFGLAEAQSQTSVGGIINSDTIWTKANSPYVLSGPLTIASGATLTIEPGVTINFNDYTVQVNGVLNARGSSTEQIIFSSDASGSGNIAFASSSMSWNEQTGTGCIIEYAVLDAASISINGASPKLNHDSITAPAQAADQAAIVTDGGSPAISNNIITGDIENLNNASPMIINNTLSGGIFGMGMLSSKPVITNNHINGGAFHREGIGIRCDGSNSYVADNVVSNCVKGIEIYDGSSVIERNLVFNNSYGIALTAHMSPVATTIRNNTVTNNEVGLSNNYNFVSLNINYNNIQDNFNITLLDINAANNWWGTNDEQAIRGMLLESVTFIPFLNEPNPQALPIPYVETAPNPPPNSTTVPTQISVSVDSSSALVGQTIYVTGNLTDKTNGTSLQGKTVILSYALEGNSTWVPIGSDITNSEGNYIIQWVTAASGIFTLKAEWTGDSNYQAASSATTLSFVPYQNQNAFLVESNSTVTSLAFNSTTSELGFTVSGETGTTGHTKVTIAKSIVSNAENLKVYLDGNQLSYAITSNADSWLLSFSYAHSSHQVTINMASNTNVPPASNSDLWTWLIVAALIGAVAVAAAGLLWKAKKKH